MVLHGFNGATTWGDWGSSEPPELGVVALVVVGLAVVALGPGPVEAASGAEPRATAHVTTAVAPAISVITTTNPRAGSQRW